MLSAAIRSDAVASRQIQQRPLLPSASRCGLPASAPTGARHCWFLPAMRKTRVSDGEEAAAGRDPLWLPRATSSRCARRPPKRGLQGTRRLPIGPAPAQPGRVALLAKGRCVEARGSRPAFVIARDIGGTYRDPLGRLLLRRNGMTTTSTGRACRRSSGMLRRDVRNRRAEALCSESALEWMVCGVPILGAVSVSSRPCDGASCQWLSGMTDTPTMFAT